MNGCLEGRGNLGIEVGGKGDYHKPVSRQMTEEGDRLI